MHERYNRQSSTRSDHQQRQQKEPIQLKNEILDNILYELTGPTLISWGLTEEIANQWTILLTKGNLPIPYITQEEFEDAAISMLNQEKYEREKKKRKANAPKAKNNH